MIALVAMLVPWATYVQLAPLTTPVTALVFTIGAAQLFFVAATQKKNVDSSVFVFATYIGLLLLSRYWTIDLENWFNAVFWWFICFVSFAGTLRFVRSPNHIRMIVYFSLAGAVIAGTKLQVNTDDWGNVLARRSVAGHNQNFTAYALSGVILFSLVSSSLIRFPAWFRLVLPSTILAILYFQVQLGTRGALISSAAVISLHVSRNVAPRLLLRLIPVMALSISLLVAFGFLEFLFGYMDSFFDRGTGDLSGRILIWGEALLFIQQSPILGIGPGSFPSVNFSGSGAHNFFLIILLETGILGGAIFTIFFAKFFRLFFVMHNRKLGGYLMGIFSAYWFPLVSSGHWETSPFSWMVVALFIRFAYICKTKDGNRYLRPFLR
ncbi:O-antigen ligase family protein [Brevirhabdus sp.]|uniref:O-antigen ligase family protein n=1 Tax=Brevirhabdus sp. TaxID=2004514 RepID=UPI004057E79F